MKYKYICDVKAMDLWKMAMERTYRSSVGLVNIVFTAAMIYMTVRFFTSANDFFKLLMLLGCFLFPVIQPLAIFGASARQLEDLPKDMELSFDENGMHVSTGNKSENIHWKKIANAIRQKNMIVIMSDDRHGYMLTNRVLGKEKEEFYNFLCSHIR